MSCVNLRATSYDRFLDENNTTVDVATNNIIRSLRTLLYEC